MKNKKVIIAIVIVLVLVVAAVAGVLIFKPFDKEWLQITRGHG